MKAAYLSRRLTLALGLLLAAVGVCAQTQTATEPFEPTIGRPGKNVEWAPTPQVLVDMMLDIAKVTSDDYVIDLGSGDGRLVIAAAARGARAHGIEYDPELVTLSQQNAAREGVSARATFAKADLFESDFSRASVITMFLLPDLNLRLRPQLLDLRPGTRIVSNTWDMEDWQADGIAKVPDPCAVWCRAFLWIVPAKVEGTWRLAQGELRLKQQFQMISGTLTDGAGPPRFQVRNWTEIGSASVPAACSTGAVNGSTMEGTTAGRTTTSWRAARAKGPASCMQQRRTTVYSGRMVNSCESRACLGLCPQVGCGRALGLHPVCRWPDDWGCLSFSSCAL